jgi:hypothetical protein
MTTNLRMLKASEYRELERNTIWILTYGNRFLGSFPGHEEPQQHIDEGLSPRKRARSRYGITGYDAALLLRA